MKITWLGHSGFRLDIADQVLLLDPWFTGNPSFPAEREAEAIAGTTAIFITHGHGDHASDAVRLSKLTGAPIYTVHELAEYFEREEGANATGFSRSGTITVGQVAVSMVPASHSSSVDYKGGNVIGAGTECGFVIQGEGHTIYFTGDTGIMADMDWIGEYFAPDIGLICAGGHYTMGMKEVAWMAKKYFDFKVIFPCHYKTFGGLEQSADLLVTELPGVAIKTPAPMEKVVM